MDTPAETSSSAEARNRPRLMPPATQIAMVKERAFMVTTNCISHAGPDLGGDGGLNEPVLANCKNRPPIPLRNANANQVNNSVRVKLVSRQGSQGRKENRSLESKSNTLD